MRCGICKQKIEQAEDMTLRRSWIHAIGQDDLENDIPAAAIVHAACDEQEQKALQAGLIYLSDIWTREPKVIWTLTAKR